MLLLRDIVLRTPDLTVFSGPSTVTIHCYGRQCAKVLWRVVRALRSSGVTIGANASIGKCVGGGVSTPSGASSCELASKMPFEGSVHLDRVNNSAFTQSADTLSSKEGVYRYLKSAVFG